MVFPLWVHQHTSTSLLLESGKEFAGFEYSLAVVRGYQQMKAMLWFLLGLGSTQHGKWSVWGPVIEKDSENSGIVLEKLKQ